MNMPRCRLPLRVGYFVAIKLLLISYFYGIDCGFLPLHFKHTRLHFSFELFFISSLSGISCYFSSPLLSLFSSFDPFLNVIGVSLLKVKSTLQNVLVIQASFCPHQTHPGGFSLWLKIWFLNAFNGASTLGVRLYPELSALCCVAVSELM